MCRVLGGPQQAVWELPRVTVIGGAILHHYQASRKRFSASELPADLLRRIFSASAPRGEPGKPLLSDLERLSCRLVCKSWRHALAPYRFLKQQLRISADSPGEVPAAAVWVQRWQAGARHLEIKLGARDSEGWDWDWENDQPPPPAVDEVYGALMALEHRSSLRTLKMTGPYCALELLLYEVECFTALTQLELEAFSEETGDIDDEWSTDAQLTPELLQHLPQLESLTVGKFDLVQLGSMPEAEAAGQGGSSGGGPPPLLPALKRVCLRDINVVVINAPLPQLESLFVDIGLSVSMSGAALHLPRLSSLSLAYTHVSVTLRCAALPALAYLKTQDAIAASDSFAHLRSLTHVELFWEHIDTPEHANLLSGVAASLLHLDWYVLGGSELERQATEIAAAAQLTRLTELAICGTDCIDHLPAWPNLEELFLSNMPPTSIEPRHVPLLAAAPNLWRLAFRWHTREDGSQNMQRLQELAEALPDFLVHVF